MANCMFLRRRYKKYIPTFTELFNDVATFSINSRNSSTSGTFNHNRPSSATQGQTWFYIYCVGSCMQISRVEMTDSTHMSIKEVAIHSNGTEYRVGLNTGLVNIQSTSSVYACEGVYIRFATYDADTIEYMFANGIYNTIKYYYSATLTDSTTADSSCRVTQDTFNNYTSGICFVAYYSNQDSNNVWSVVDGHTPTTLIKGAYGSSWWTKSPIYGYTSGSTAFYRPIRTNQTSTNAPYTRTLTWKHIKENW